MKDGQLFQPAFTDILEFQKFNRDNKLRPVVVEAEKVPTVLAAEAGGIILNVLGVNLPLTVNRPGFRDRKHLRLRLCLSRHEKTVVGLLAHVDAGKTTLSEAILYWRRSHPQAGESGRQGCVFRYL